ncbi:hypothetical protein CK565_02430 [Campylobacter lari]|nr:MULTISPECIES: hypothetical protein [Campylobacter]EAI4441141.1 hypothetical protein [Campylobacter lari]EAJ6152330.1 hypothetical protein [Campylobacter lari]EAK5577494.1 hypothetical protein [Campylobacter lari]EDP6880147.1 hypothetical protein [Campylobacter lari]MCV3373832.1 hypothetical protein [Campylobacter lari]
MDKVDSIANIAWAIGGDYELDLIEQKLGKFSSEQLKQFDSRIDKLNLKEAPKLRFLTFFFGAFGIARFMTGRKVAGWIRIFLLVAILILPRIVFNGLQSEFAGIAFVFGGAILIGLKILIIILWIWDITRADDLAYSYNFYQIMDLIQNIENEDKQE